MQHNIITPSELQEVFLNFFFKHDWVIVFQRNACFALWYKCKANASTFEVQTG